jgi:tetratricopeptide (TPR) repeat protein
MKLFKKLFGRTVSMETLRQALLRQEWAQALAIGRDLQGTALDTTEQHELAHLLKRAGDSLAELNLNEGDAFLRLGDEGRAREHFGLALEQARDDTLRERAEAALNGLVPIPAHRAGATACASCAPSAAPVDGNLVEDDLDPQTRLDLLLAAYPPALAERYQQAPPLLQEAFLLAHAGMDQQAMNRLEEIPLALRDDLFQFEYGTLAGRLGAVAQACLALDKAAMSPTLRMYALEAMIHLQMNSGQTAEAKKRLLTLLDNGEAPAFCHARLAQLAAARGETDQALEHGRQALTLGAVEGELLLLLASLLESRGALTEAEHLLSRLPGKGGCSGGTVNTYLAEFWMRHGMHLDRSLEAFKGATRSEPDNPRWPLRIAQTYLQRGWKKEGLALLEKVLTAPELDPELYREGRALLEANR